MTFLMLLLGLVFVIPILIIASVALLDITVWRATHRQGTKPKRYPEKAA